MPRETAYERSRVLRAAAWARKRRKPRKALALYLEALAREPNNTDLLRKIAPLQAQTRQPGEAWQTYRTTVERLYSRGFVDQAIGVSRDACEKLPCVAAAWKQRAQLEIARGRHPDAIECLLEGRVRLSGRRHRKKARLLLELAQRIDATHFEVNVELARVLALDGARLRARRILDDLAVRSAGRKLRRVRGLTFRLYPGPRTAWRWFRSALAQ